MRRTAMAIVAVAAASIAWLAMPGQSAFANNGGCAQVNTGGLSLDNGKCVPAKKARLVNGKAIAPASAPQEVKDIIRRANRIRTKPYRLGGGHRNFRIDSSYDCSGAVSFALGKRFFSSPLPSGPMMRWGKAGKGKWITVYANPGHAYMVVAGLRFDTANNGSSGSGPRWSKSMRSTRGSFTARSPRGF